MELFLIKSAACLGIFYIFYKLLLENSALHTTKRFYLLGTLVISFVIPFITFTEYVEVPAISQTFVETPTADTTEVSNETPFNYIPFILWTIYGMGVFVGSVRFIKNLVSLYQKVRQNPSVHKKNMCHVLLRLPVTPHSFLHYIFFHKHAYEAGQIPEEVIVHETAHVIQKHSWDTLFIELLRIVFWFNPLLYFIKKSIKLNHEFLADRSVLKHGADASSYQNILLDFSSTSSVPPLVHSINYSSIKKRFTVMKKRTSTRAAWLKGLLMLPLLAMLIYGFSGTNMKYIATEDPTSVATGLNVLDLAITNENKISFGNSFLAISDLEPLVQAKNYTTAALNISPKASIPFCKDVVTELVRLDIAKQMSVCSSSDGKGGLTQDDFAEIMSPLHNRFKKQDKGKTSFFINTAQYKPFVIIVQLSEVTLNGKPTSLETFARDIDKITKNWEETDYTSLRPLISIASTPKDFLEKLDAEYKKTHFSKANGGLGLLPPPPPPPPAPSPAKVPDAPKTKLVQYNSKDGKVKTTAVQHVPPPPAPEAPRVIKGVNDRDANVPPPPPPPPPAPESPIEQITKMAQKGAAFYYDGKKIPSAKAIELIKRNPDLNIQLSGSDSKNPQVKIFTKSIQLDHNKKTGLIRIHEVAQPPNTLEVNTLDFARVLAGKGAVFHLGPHTIPAEQAIELLQKNSGMGYSVQHDGFNNPVVTFDGC